MKHPFPILLVEDDPVSRKVVEKTLVNAGHEVKSVENGRKALELFKDHFFPILLTSWMMPEMDGLELCQAIRKDTSKGYVYIIVMTTKYSKDDVVSGLEAGADDYLTKPLNYAELIARIRTGMRVLELERSLKEANEEIKALSLTDPLTGIYNRGYLTERLPREIKRARRYGHSLSILLCDLDHFKIVNDTYGHQVGDQVLKECVQCIAESIRNKIDWVARYGGEEFIIVVPETDLGGANMMAERLRHSFSQKVITVQKAVVQMTASFGVTSFDPDTPSEKISPEAMINRADKYLYQAKQAGRNRVRGGKL